MHSSIEAVIDMNHMLSADVFTLQSENAYLVAAMENLAASPGDIGMMARQMLIGLTELRKERELAGA